MQENEQGYPKQQNEKRNPELAVCKDGFEHALSCSTQVCFFYTSHFEVRQRLIRTVPFTRKLRKLIA